jgi:mannosyltransferase OCH1-like enzyme
MYKIYLLSIMFLYGLILVILLLYLYWSYGGKESFTDPKESFTDSVIPLKIFQTWSTKELPYYMNLNSIKLQKQNPQFEYFLFDDDDCLQFIETHFDSDVVDAYNKLIPGAYKADLWRYCVLYIHGGIYLDMKMSCVGDFRLIELTKQEHYVKDRPQLAFMKNHIGIYNAVMIQEPKNPLMLDCIVQIVKNVENQEYGYSALYPTGPGMLGQLYQKKKEVYKLPDLDLIHDTDRETIRYRNRTILEHYSQYRAEQLNHQNDLHYSVLWDKSSIYAL